MYMLIALDYGTLKRHGFVGCRCNAMCNELVEIVWWRDGSALPTASRSFYRLLRALRALALFEHFTQRTHSNAKI